MAVSDCCENGYCSVSYQVLERIGVLFWSPRKDHYTTKKRHICDILGRKDFFCHAYDTSMTIIVTKPGIIIDVVGSDFYEKKS